MITSFAKQAIIKTKQDWNQMQKNAWKHERDIAFDYYKGRTHKITQSYFSKELIQKIPIANINVTKRIIDRISLVYMKPPKRIYSNDEVQIMLHDKDQKMQRAERLTNLLELILIKPCWRAGRIEYDLIIDFEPHFDSDPLTPVAYTYPLQARSEVMDTTPELFAYWDAETHFVYDKNGKIHADPDNPNQENPYGILPFVECFKDGKPESSFLDTDASTDLIATNCTINVDETNKNANVMFQSFGYMYINGSHIETKDLEVGQDKISNLGADGTMNIVSPPNSVPALTDSIKESYKMLAQNYHLTMNFVEGTSAESGVALKLRNQELTDERLSDVVRWRQVERKVFEIESTILSVEGTMDAGDLEMVDFDESTEILNQDEQLAKWEWELSKGIIDVADILMQKDSDRFPDRETALDYLFERQQQEQPEQEQTSPLLEALTTPT
jgi:hypothetical protein